MDSVKIFHIADVHLGAPFSGAAPAEAAARRMGLEAALARAVIAAKKRGVQLFFISGDLFDSEYVRPSDAELLTDKLGSFPDCRFFISPGNHDPYGTGSFYERVKLPANVHVFREKSRVELDDLGVDVYGFGFDSARCEESPVKGYPPLRSDRINILVCHGDVGSEGSPYGPISKADIALSGFDYIALGHIHKASGVLCEGGVHYAYPGCIEGRGFDEAGDKGGLCGTVGKGTVSLEHVSLSARRYEIAELDITGFESRSEVVTAINEALKPYSGARVRVLLVGRPTDAFYISAAAFETGGSNPDYIEIKDKSRPSVSFTEIEKENTLRGAFYRRMNERIESVDADDPKREIYISALKAGLAALEDRDIEEV